MITLYTINITFSWISRNFGGGERLLMQKMIIYYRKIIILALDFQDETGMKEIQSSEGELYMLRCFSEAEPSYTITIQGEEMEIMPLENSTVLHKKLMSLPFQVFLSLEKDDKPSDHVWILNEISTLFLRLYNKESLKSWNGQVDFFTPFQNAVRNFVIEEKDTSTLITNLSKIRGRGENNSQDRMLPNEPIIINSKFKMSLLWNIPFLLAGIILLVINFTIVENPPISLLFTYLWVSCLMGIFLTFLGNILKVKDMKIYEFTLLSFVLCLTSSIMGYLTFTILDYFFSPL